jgi:hypothetical protein
MSTVASKQEKSLEQQTWLSEILFHKVNLINIFNALRHKNIKRSQRKYFSRVIFNDSTENNTLERMNTHTTNIVYMNLQFFAGQVLPRQLYYLYESVKNKNQVFTFDDPATSFDSIDNESIVRLKKEWNENLKNFIISLNDSEIAKFILFSDSIKELSDIYELFFVNDISFLIEGILNIDQKLFASNLTNREKESDYEITIKDLKNDNSYLVRIIDELERDILEVTEKSQTYENELLSLNVKLDEKDRNAKITEEQFQKYVSEISDVMRKNESLNQSIAVLENILRDLKNENEQLYERISSRKCFPFF